MRPVRSGTSGFAAHSWYAPAVQRVGLTVCIGSAQGTRTMRGSGLLGALIVVVVLAPPVGAGSLTIGPFVDTRGFFDLPPPIVIPTQLPCIPLPFDGTIHINDQITTLSTPSVPIIALTFITFNVAGDPQIEGPISFTDVWARDMNPTGTGSTA
jgi:hypothetical protein